MLGNRCRSGDDFAHKESVTAGNIRAKAYLYAVIDEATYTGKAGA